MSDLSPSMTMSIEEEITSIISETSRLEEHISKLNERRSHLLQRLNDIRSYTKTFPPEILVNIFQHYLPYPEFDSFDVEQGFRPTPNSEFFSQEPLPATIGHTQITILSAVSRLWRTTVHTTPYLWEAAEITLTRDSIENKAELLRLYLNNVADVSFSLKLHKREPPLSQQPQSLLPSITEVSSSNAMDLQPVFQVIVDGAHKFKRLCSTFEAGNWLGLFSVGGFRNLEEFSLHQRAWPARTVRTLQSVSAHLEFWPNTLPPSLTHLLLSGASLIVPRDSPPYTSITVLHLVHLNVITSIQLLFLCPNLVEYRAEPRRYQFMSSHNDLQFTLINRIHVFKAMKDFQIKRALDRIFCRIYSRLRFPALETLGIGLRGDAGMLPLLLNFLRSLPLSWSTLDLNPHKTVTEDMINQVFMTTPINVHTLRIFCNNISLLEQTLRALTSREIVGMQGLRTVRVLRAWGGASPPLSDSFESALAALPRLVMETMLTRRNWRVETPFLFELPKQLELDQNGGLDWKNVKDTFWNMIVKGLKFRVLIGGKLIDCLEQLRDELDEEAQ